MLTIDEVAAIPLFSTLPAADLERLARTSADLQLSPGEFAVHEGGEGALFAVLAGKIEVVKTVRRDRTHARLARPGHDLRRGADRPWHAVSRADIAPPNRRACMRVDVQQYYAIAAVSKDVAQKVSALARERIGGLQSITAEPQKPRVTLIGHRWDTACGELAPLSGAQPDLLQLADARCAGTVDALARTRPAGRRWSGGTAGGRRR